MVRAPCCEKMGLKKGPWTAEEDEVLVGHIEKHGHDNWRALPKQAGLLRCGKSCRLRWMNYLRPDIKRGSFTKEEEETIINLHEQLGNRWSAIAARLPGRTDNEIKNVWHTHLKKRLNPSSTAQEPKKKRTKSDAKTTTASKANSKRSKLATDSALNTSGDSSFMSASPAQSCSDFSCTTDLSAQDGNFTYQEFPEIDESIWTEEFYADVSLAAMDLSLCDVDASLPNPVLETLSSFSSSGSDDMDFWFGAFMESGGLQDLPQF